MAEEKVRFFELEPEPNGERRLLVGIMHFEGTPETDGGRREAVRAATMADCERWPGEYADYYTSFSRAGQLTSAIEFRHADDDAGQQG